MKTIYIRYLILLLISIGNQHNSITTGCDSNIGLPHSKNINPQKCLKMKWYVFWVILGGRTDEGVNFWSERGQYCCRTLYVFTIVDFITLILLLILLFIFFLTLLLILLILTSLFSLFVLLCCISLLLNQKRTNKCFFIILNCECKILALISNDCLFN